MNQQRVAHWRSRAAVKDRLRVALRDLRIATIDCSCRRPYCMPAELFSENQKFLLHNHWLAKGASIGAGCPTRAAG